MIKTFQKLFEDTLKDTYNAEKQFLKTMPKLSKAAHNADLKKTIDAHIEETKEHISRLEKVAEMLDIKPTGKVCKAAQGLVEEAEEHLEEVQPGPVLDAGIIICAQKNEHYEICAYGTLVSWAKDLGLTEVSAILKKTLDEELNANKLLDNVAIEQVNDEAEAVSTKA
ncbi:ferritin-like domain-containing protein [soil metagenome]